MNVCAAENPWISYSFSSNGSRVVNIGLISCEDLPFYTLDYVKAKLT
jgi:hypothetical protein